jgi:hypothetical protein
VPEATGSKTTETKMESPQQIEKRGASLKGTSKSRADIRKEPVVKSGGSGENRPVQEASLGAEAGRVKTEERWFKRYAAHAKQALERVLPASLPELNWDRIATIVTGILLISMIYGLAFGLGRLPARRRAAGAHGGTRETGAHAGRSVPQ